MGKVVLEITMSLDGYVAGPNISTKQPLGEDGTLLHDWIFGDKTDIDQQLLDESMQSYGAVILGRHTYDTAIEEAWEGTSPFTIPAFVLSKDIPAKAIAGFTFINTGINSALAHTRAIAGNKNVWIMGGANVAQQYIKAGLTDELNIHIAHVLLGKGTKLFDDTGNAPVKLGRIYLVASQVVTHTKFRVVK